MSDLIAVAYPDRLTAERVRARLDDAIKARLIAIDDVVIVTRDQDGKVELDQAVSTVRSGAKGSAYCSGLIDLMFLAQ